MDERHSYRQESETPLDILKSRYAKGEITKEQYEQMRQEIS
ncbi:MAG: SHOCT domain-containing protein [Acidobacteria bacterium]|nr:SHOCT domain-containing protein [Acidobacteriota bacterium]